MTFVPEISHALSGPNDPQAADQATYIPQVTTALLASADNGYDMDGTGRGTPIIAHLAPTLSSNGNAHSGQRDDGMVVYRKAQKAHDSEDGERWEPDDKTGTVSSHGTTTAEAVVIRTGGDFGDPTVNVDDKAFLAANPMSDRQMAVMDTHSAVRRLTPTECERLQGFPDGWTAGVSDSARYRMLGNAICVPVAEWIGGRMVAYHTAAVKAATGS